MKTFEHRALEPILNERKRNKVREKRDREREKER